MCFYKPSINRQEDKVGITTTVLRISATVQSCTDLSCGRGCVTVIRDSRQKCGGHSAYHPFLGHRASAPVAAAANSDERKARKSFLGVGEVNMKDCTLVISGRNLGSRSYVHPLQPYFGFIARNH